MAGNPNWKKGKSGNPAGKPKGTKAKKTTQWEALAESITGEQADRFAAYLNDLWDSGNPEKMEKAAEFFIKTVEYFKPKQARVESIVDAKVGITSIRFEDAED